MDDHQKFDTMRGFDKFIVGLHQEMMLTMDESGGSDGMWFSESVDAVSTDSDGSIEKLAKFFGTSVEDLKSKAEENS